MKKLRQMIVKILILLVSSIFIFSFGFSQNTKTDLLKVVDDVAGKNVPQATTDGKAGVKSIQEIVVNEIGYGILMPLFVVIGILLALINFYKLMFSTKEEEQTKAISQIIWGIVGILIMGSAIFITSVIVSKSGTLVSNTPTGIVTNIYDKIVAPFLKIFLFLASGILFLILIVHAFKFLTTPSEDIKKHSKTIIIWNIFGILIMLGATFIVEFIMGPRSYVTSYVYTVGDIGAGIFAGKVNVLNFIINTIKLILTFTAFFVLIIIIYQAYLLLFKPTDTEIYKKIKRNFLYVLIGAAVLFGVYLFVNFLIIK